MIAKTDSKRKCFKEVVIIDKDEVSDLFSYNIKDEKEDRSLLDIEYR